LSSIESMSSILSPANASAFSAAGCGPVSMIVGSDPVTAVATTRARRRHPEPLARTLVPNQHKGRAVDDPRRVAGVVNVIDLFDRGVLLGCDVVPGRRCSS
jgi:hypothetical protein